MGEGGGSNYFEGSFDLCFLYDNGLWCHQRCFLISFIHKCMLQDIIGYSSTFFYYTNHHSKDKGMKKMTPPKNKFPHHDVGAIRERCHRGVFCIMLQEMPGLLNYH